MKINEAVRKMHPPRYTTAQAAEMVGRSEDTLARWRKKNYVKASDEAAFGSITVPLYTDEDIEALRRLAKTLKPGRTPSSDGGSDNA
jgi:hypothetical protein